MTDAPPPPRLRLIFMGSPAFAVPALQALAAAHDVIAVYCQPPKPAGRGLALSPCPVQLAAELLHIPVFTPCSFKKEPESIEVFAAHQADLAVVAAYGLILPPAVLAVPRYGCVNIHASLLPRWRGAAPLQRAIEAGDSETGVAIMQMEAGLDTGPVWRMAATPITATTTLPQLHDAMAALGAQEIMAALPAIIAGEKPTPQPEEGVTYAAKITREEGAINWHDEAATIERRLRAFTPWPGLYFMFRGLRVKLLAATVAEPTGGEPGTLLTKQGIIACGNGTALQLLTVQPEGKPKQSFADFINGQHLKPGDSL